MMTFEFSPNSAVTVVPHRAASMAAEFFLLKGERWEVFGL